MWVVVKAWDWLRSLWEQVEGRGWEETEQRLIRSSSKEGRKAGEPGVPKERDSKRKEGAPSSNHT